MLHIIHLVLCVSVCLSVCLSVSRRRNTDSLMLHNRRNRVYLSAPSQAASGPANSSNDHTGSHQRSPSILGSARPTSGPTVPVVGRTQVHGRTQASLRSLRKSTAPQRRPVPVCWDGHSFVLETRCPSGHHFIRVGGQT